jgi:hypothetical protein
MKSANITNQSIWQILPVNQHGKYYQSINMANITSQSTWQILPVNQHGKYYQSINMANITSQSIWQILPVNQYGKYYQSINMALTFIHSSRGPDNFVVRIYFVRVLTSRISLYIVIIRYCFYPNTESQRELFYPNTESYPRGKRVTEWCRRIASINMA